MGGLTNRPRTRKERILDLLNQGKSPLEIAHEVNCERSLVYKTARAAGVKMLKARPGPRPVGFNPVASKLAYQIGQRVFLYHRAENDFPLEQVAVELNMTVPKLSKLMAGVYDPTLGELQRIGRMLGVPLPELVTEKDNRVRPV